MNWMPFYLTPFLLEGTNYGQTTAIQTWVSGRCFLENKGIEPVTGDTDENVKFQWTDSDFKQKSKFWKT